MVRRTGIEPVRDLVPADFKSAASACSATLANIIFLEAAPRFELGSKGFAHLCLTTWLCRLKWSGKRDSNSRPSPWQGDALPLSYFRINGASGQNRTVDTRIFSPLLYRLSSRGIMATRKGLEPSTSAVTGRHSNQLNYRAIFRNRIIYYIKLQKPCQHFSRQQHHLVMTNMIITIYITTCQAFLVLL